MVERSAEVAAVDCSAEGAMRRRRHWPRRRSSSSVRKRFRMFPAIGLQGQQPDRGRTAAARHGDGHGSSLGRWSSSAARSEVVQAIRLLTRFGQVQDDPSARPEDLQKEFSSDRSQPAAELAAAAGKLAAKATSEQEDTPLLIEGSRAHGDPFALERYSKGEVKSTLCTR